MTMEDVLEAIERADYRDETGVYREYLEGLENPEEVVVNGEQYSVVGINTESLPSIGVTNSRLKEQKGKPDVFHIGLSCEGDILILTTAGVRNRVWETVESVEVRPSGS